MATVSNLHRRHQWVAVVTYILSEEQIRAGMGALNEENRLSVDGPGCANCEALYGDAAPECPADWFAFV
jgi:hypothetical protein